MRIFAENLHGHPRIAMRIDDTKFNETYVNANVAIAKSAGLYEMFSTKCPESPDMFTHYMSKWVADDENKCFNQTWEPYATTVRLSREKVAGHAKIAPHLETFATNLAGDAQLSKWWACEMTYRRGSDMAKRAMQILNLSEAELEEIVKECKA